jgi:hypothetical protein
MVLDGGRALAGSGYITPSSGDHAGQIGPWARLVGAVGIPPESVGMKAAFVVMGLLWLALGFGVALESSWAWVTGLVLSVGTLWYLAPGTIISLAVILLLLTPPVRRALGH